MDNSASPATPATQQLVTASDLVRRFGYWQDRATREPVYILHRGRPRLVVTSVDLMDALCTPHATPTEKEPIRLSALLDGMHEMVLVLTDDGRVIVASRSARRYFGTSVDGGSNIADLDAPDASLLARAVRRVAETGLTETVDLLPRSYPGRRLACTIEPLDGGAAIFAQDITTDDTLADVEAAQAADAAAIDMIGGVAHVTINPRGYLVAPTPSLAALTGISASVLASARFVTLFAVSSRVALGEALEAAIEGEPRRLTAAMLVNRTEPVPVRIGLAPRRAGRAVAAVSAVIATETPASMVSGT